MDWRPLHTEHAIERVRVIVQLGSRLPTKFVRSLAADNEERRLDLGFTSKNLREGQQITFGPGGVALGKDQSELFGWDWQRISAANTPIETLVVENETLVYETAEYSRWSGFSERFQEVARPLLDRILDLVDAGAFSLEYIDRFVFDGNATEAAPSLIQKKVWELLPEQVSSGSSVWHVHRGWFEDLNGHRILINQNLDAQDGRSADGRSVRSLQILTKTELRPDKVSFDYGQLAIQLKDMHDRSNVIFKSILNEEMQLRVGLSGGNHGQT